jgi:hypothetical protein
VDGFLGCAFVTNIETNFNVPIRKEEDAKVVNFHVRFKESSPTFNFGRHIQSNIHGNNLMDGSTKVLVDVPISKHGKTN